MSAPDQLQEEAPGVHEAFHRAEWGCDGARYGRIVSHWAALQGGLPVVCCCPWRSDSKIFLEGVAITANFSTTLAADMDAPSSGFKCGNRQRPPGGVTIVA